VAWDPIAQKEHWRIRFERPGVTGGTLSTAGNLLFHGSNDGGFAAYTPDKGEKLWSIPLAPGFANPITYTVVVGWTDRRTERTYSSTGTTEAFSYTATVTVFNDPAS